MSKMRLRGRSDTKLGTSEDLDLTYWLVGLAVWFSLRVRENPGSTPGRAHSHFSYMLKLDFSYKKSKNEIPNLYLVNGRFERILVTAIYPLSLLLIHFDPSFKYFRRFCHFFCFLRVRRKLFIAIRWEKGCIFYVISRKTHGSGWPNGLRRQI